MLKVEKEVVFLAGWVPQNFQRRPLHCGEFDASTGQGSQQGVQEGVVIEHKGACNCMQGGGCLPLAPALP